MSDTKLCKDCKHSWVDSMEIESWSNPMAAASAVCRVGEDPRKARQCEVSGVVHVVGDWPKCKMERSREDPDGCGANASKFEAAETPDLFRLAARIYQPNRIC